LSSSLPFDFHQSLSSSSRNLGTKVFDKLSTLVRMGESNNSASLGISQGKGFNNRFLRDIILKGLIFASHNPFSGLLLASLETVRIFKALSSSGPFQELSI